MDKPDFSNYPFPYHLNHYRAGYFKAVKYYSEQLNIEPTVYIQPKYDGTHLQILRQNGNLILRKHSGKLADRWQWSGFNQVEPYKKELIEVWLKEHNDMVLEAELFGNKYTPMLFHKDHDKDWDLVVFEVGKAGKEVGWIPYPEWDQYNVPLELRIPWVLSYSINDILEYDDPESLISMLKDESPGPYYEGWILKCWLPRDKELLKEKPYKEAVKKMMRYNLWIVKLKPERRRPVEDPKIRELASEYENELAKLGIDAKLLLYELPLRIYKDHPLLEPSDKSGKFRLFLKSLGFLADKWWEIDYKP